MKKMSAARERLGFIHSKVEKAMTLLNNAQDELNRASSIDIPGEKEMSDKFEKIMDSLYAMDTMLGASDAKLEESEELNG